MADSKISRTLAGVTRRKLVAGAAMAGMVQTVHIKSSPAAFLPPGEGDLAAWARVADPLAAHIRLWAGLFYDLLKYGHRC